jgi:hypothetical protein
VEEFKGWLFFDLLALQVLVPRQLTHISHSVNMEWGFKENRVAVIALYKCKKSDSQIFKLLKPLKISQNFVYRAIKRNKELWGVEDRAWSERLKSVRAEAAIKTVGADSPKSALEKEDHVLRAHLRSKGHLLTPALREIRRTSAERLLQWHAENGHKNILFKDEKFFTIKEQYNNQNNKIYAQTSHEVHSEGAGMPSPFLRHGLVGVVPSEGDTSSFLQERGETGVRVYQEDVLQGVVKQLNMTLFSGQEWVFQKDLAPTYKAKTTKE